MGDMGVALVLETFCTGSGGDGSLVGILSEVLSRVA